jgi:hypothetical protein
MTDLKRRVFVRTLSPLGSGSQHPENPAFVTLCKPKNFGLNKALNS